MSKDTEDAPAVWGSDEIPVEGKEYSFINPTKAISSPVRKTWKDRDNKERKFLTGRFVCENEGKFKFVGHKLIGQRKNNKNEFFYKKNRRKYYFFLKKDFKVK